MSNRNPLRSMQKDPAVYSLIAAARAQGWTVEITRDSHLRFQGPAGGLVFHGGTPSDHRATRNLRAQLRRAGLEV